MTEALLHAIDLAIADEWEHAKTIVESLDQPVADRLFLLISAFEEREHARLRQLSTVRHEIGNALSIAQANLEAMADGVLEATPERLESIVAALAGTGAILDDLRRAPKQAVSNIVQLGDFDICALIGAHVAALSGMAQAKGVTLEYQACGQHYDTCVKYRGDQTRVGQILRNVMINAVRYTPPGGNIAIDCRTENAELSLTIRDTGVGISAEDLPHLFESGYRGGNTTTKGSGLGLSVVQKLVKAMGGSANLLPGEEGGAVFTLALPAFSASP